jgi:hypothetical protein
MIAMLLRHCKKLHGVTWPLEHPLFRNLIKRLIACNFIILFYRFCHLTRITQISYTIDGMAGIITEISSPITGLQDIRNTQFEQ